MKKHLCILITFAAFASPVFGEEEITVNVFHSGAELEAKGEPLIFQNMKPLFLELQKPQDSDFITTAGGDGKNLKWRVQYFMVLSEKLISANFSEGHVDVIGIFILNPEKKQWELSTEEGGRFKVQVYDEETGKPKEGEIATIGQPSNRPEIKADDKPQPEAEEDSR